MDIAELFVRHVGVNLGGGDVGVLRRAWTERRSAPLLNRSVAKQWRMTWGVTFLEIPASIARCLSIRSTDRGVRRV